MLTIKDDDRVERIINGLDAINVDDIDNIKELSKVFGINYEELNAKDSSKKWGR